MISTWSIWQSSNLLLEWKLMKFLNEDCIYREWFRFLIGGPHNGAQVSQNCLKKEKKNPPFTTKIENRKRKGMTERRGKRGRWGKRKRKRLSRGKNWKKKWEQKEKRSKITCHWQPAMLDQGRRSMTQLGMSSDHTSTSPETEMSVLV